MVFRRVAPLLAALIVAPAIVRAQDPVPAPVPEPVPATDPDPKDDRITDLETRLDDLADQNEKLTERVDILEEDLAYAEQRVDKLAPLAAKLTGYFDFGFFGTTGNGAGTRTDVANTYFPEYAGVVPDTWVFMGDPLSTAVNARGEPADTGESRAIAFDSINSGGKPTFAVSSLSMTLFAGIGTRATVNGAFDLVPRARDASSPGGGVGDYVDVKLAYLEYRIPRPSWHLDLSFGKFDSVLGFEYRSQDAPDRLTVSPSLICRYTCGRPLGIKARFHLPSERFVANVAVTNGSHFSEIFPFSNEIDVNAMKTVAGRLSFRQRLGDAGFVELGGSAAFGAQDFQPEDDRAQWHVGGDLRVEWKDLELTGEYVKGDVAGETEASMVACGLSPCLAYQGAYGLIGYRVTNVFEPYARVDWRDATHQDGASFVYLSQVLRATAGLRAEIGQSVVVKAEYTVNRELGRIPQFPDDIFTSALVVKF